MNLKVLINDYCEVIIDVLNCDYGNCLCYEILLVEIIIVMDDINGSIKYLK